MINRFSIALCFLFLTLPTLAEDVFVKQAAVPVRAGKGSAYDEVATVKKGDKLQVVAREGDWLKVRANGKEGYVFKTAIDTKNPSGGGKLGGDLGRMFSGASGGSTASSGAAGKGLGESLQYARTNGMSPAGLDRMIAMNKALNAPEWEAFMTQGKVGPKNR